MKDNFAGWSHVDIYARLVGGKCLWDRLCEDKRASRDPKSGITMGSLYFKTLRSLYNPPDSAVNKLKVRNELDVVRENLRKALKSARCHPPNRAALEAFFSSTKSLNQREAVGLVRYIAELKPSSSPDVRAAAAEVQRPPATPRPRCPAAPCGARRTLILAPYTLLRARRPNLEAGYCEFCPSPG